MFRSTRRPEDARRTVSVLIDGEAVRAEEGELLAAVLLRTPPFTSRRTAVSGTPRAPFCMMGACFDCIVDVDDRRSVRSCLVAARDGMAIVRPHGRPDLGGEASR